MKEDSNLIQKVGAELLSVKRMGHLSGIFNTTLKSSLRYAQAAIFILDTESNLLRNLFHNEEPLGQEHFFLAEVDLKELSAEEVLLADSQELDGFGEFLVQGNWQHARCRKYISDTPANGSRILVFPLRDRNDFIGNLFLHFQNASDFSSDKVNLLKLLAININMAVIRVLAQERILLPGNNDQHLKLLNLSYSLTGVQNIEGLNSVVSEMILPMFEADSCVVMLKSEEQLHRCYMRVIRPESREQQIDEDVYSGPFPVQEYCYQNTNDDCKLTIFSMEGLASQMTKPAFFHAEKQNGICEKATYPIYLEDSKIGYLFFNRARSNVQIDLDNSDIKLILSQFSKAILYTIDQEQVRIRLEQKDMLIGLGIRFASVRNNEELLEEIHQSLQEVIGFTHTNLAVINNGKSSIDTYFIDPCLAALQHYDYSNLLSGSPSIDDGFIGKVLLSDEPLVFDLENPAITRPLPGYLKINYDRGIRQVVMTKFTKEKDLFGFWILAFDHNNTISRNVLLMIRDVARQLSVAVQNNLVNIEHERQHKERDRLMQFNSSIVAIKDKSKLVETIKEHLRELFKIDNFLVWSLSHDQQFRSPFLFDENALFDRQPDFRTPKEHYLKNEGGIYNDILKEAGVCYFDAGELEAEDTGHPFFYEPAQLADQTCIGGNALRVGNEVVGILTFSSQHIHLVKEREELYLSICSQLAIVASNLFSTEKISEQLAEISRFKERLEDEKIYLQQELEISVNKSDMIGNSQEIRVVHKLIEQVAYTDSSVLILGETGTGKELVARSVHTNSPRKSKLMVKVNCAALPANLIESELFGHEKGSFTGAVERRLGKFELANNGTLFLDEIGEMPLDLQGKLLRALQEKEIERVGGKTVIKVDVRVIAATNRNLEKEVALGNFRSDLFYRINIFPIRLPPLRDRTSDIPLLASHFISKYAAKAGKDIKSLSGKVLRELQRYNWPGNIRELEHMIERAVLLTRGDTLNVVDIPTADSDMPNESMYLEKKIKTLDENERDHIIRILKLCRGRVTGQNGAAALLGIPPSTLNSKMKRLDINKNTIKPKN